MKMIFRLFTGVVMMSAVCEAGPTLLLAGDSTLDDYGRKPRPPYASWGTELEKSMKPGCKVDNYAKSGASTKSFIEAGYWAKLMAAVKPGDYVGIQFGHNDQKCSNKFYLEKRFAPPDGLFKENVRKFVSDIRAKGGKPILMSPIVRGSFGKDGKLVDKIDEPVRGGYVSKPFAVKANTTLDIRILLNVRNERFPAAGISGRVEMKETK